MAKSSDGSIRYSDLIVPDDAVNNLINQLERLGETYGNLVKEIQGQSRQLEDALGKVSGATAGGQESIRKMAEEAEKLFAKYKQAAQVSSAVEEEIRTVRELEGAISREIGTRERNSRVMAEQQRLLKQAHAALNAYHKAVNEGARLSDEEWADYAALNAEISEHTVLLNKARTALAQETKEMLAADGSIRQLQAQVNRLSNTWANMEAEMRESAEGQEFYKTLQKQTDELSRLEQAMGNYRRNVGNYSSAWNGLGVSVQQVVRELPSLSMGFNTFFLAISNNLPMLTDEIKAATAAYKEAVAQGNKATPVWKQLLSSVMSWQTALVVGITLLTQYGDELVDWVKGLFSAKEALDSAAEAQKIVGDTMARGAKDAQREKVQLDLLYKSATDVTKPMEERRKAADEMQRLYPSYLGNMSDEDILAGKAADAYSNLSQELVRTARAKAALDKITENQQKLLELEPQLSPIDTELEAAKAEYERLRKLQPAAPTSPRPVTTGGAVAPAPAQTDLSVQAGIVSQLQERYNELKAQIDTLNTANEQLAGMVKTEDVIEATGGGTAAGKEGLPRAAKADTYDPYGDELEARRKYEDAFVSMMDDEWAKRRARTILQYRREREDLQRELDTNKKLTEQAQEDIAGRMVMLTEQRDAELAEIERKRQLELLEIEREGLELRMKGLSEESEQYHRLRNSLFDVDKRISLARNAALPTGQRQPSGDVAAASDRERDAYNYGYELSQYDAYLEEAYDMDYASEKAKTAMRLEMEKARWEKILELTQKYGSEVTGHEVEQVRQAISAIEQEMSKIGKGWDSSQSVWGNLYDMVFGNSFGKDEAGERKAEAFKESLSDSVEFAMEQLQNFLDYRAELADKAVENAEKEVDAAQSALEAERQARANGYASNVQQAQKELALAKKNQDKALKEQEKAQKQQQALQTVQQISNMVTATTLVWAQVGWPLALVATAIMWASFAAAKIKAAQMARSTEAATETYGDGTVELLQGGSHQSGNDVDLGRKKDGTRRRAEGGEFFAVINKRSSRRFRSVIPDVINSLNNGTFAHKYLGAYKDADSLSLNVAAGRQEQPGIGALADDVREIRDQGRRRTYTDSRGRTVVEYKNLKRITRN